MNQARAMRGAERMQRLLRDVQHARGRERTVDIELPLDGASVEVLEDHVVVVVRRDAEIEDLDGVLRLDLHGRARLAREPLERRVILSQPRLEQLDRDLAVHREMVGSKHRAHATFAEQGVEPVTSVQDDSDEAFCETLCHRTNSIARSACRSSSGTRTSPKRGRPRQPDPTLR